jgi:biotin synthase
MHPGEAVIDELKARVIAGGDITFEEALALLAIEEDALYEKLLEAARAITLHFNSNKAHLCSLINAKSYLCSEDCGFCGQSTHFKTEANRYSLLSADEIVKAAKVVETQGVHNFCIVTSGGALSDEEFEHVLEAVKRLKQETGLNIDASVGFLTRERVDRLKEAGLRRFNNNLQSSREFYPEIVSTHSYDKRLETNRMLREGGMDLCSGGILGMGESREDRAKLAFELKRFTPECVPVNVLNPRPGTPLENTPPTDPKEVIKTIAVFRFILPKSNIKLAGGREVNLGERQLEALKAGANGLVSGGYLTTGGNSFQTDKALLREAGFTIARD